MKIVRFCFVLILFSTSAIPQDITASNSFTGRSLPGSDTTNTIPEHFNDLAQQWMRAYNGNDSAALAAMYTPDAEYISSHVRGLVVQGRDRVIGNFQEGISAGGHIDSLSILSFQSSCDMAVLLCRYEATNNGKKAIGRNLLVVKKINDRWLIMYHMTVV